MGYFEYQMMESHRGYGMNFSLGGCKFSLKKGQQRAQAQKVRDGAFPLLMDEVGMDQKFKVEINEDTKRGWSDVYRK